VSALGTLCLVAVSAARVRPAEASSACPSPGSKVPVILVHGKGGAPSDFTAHSYDGDEPLELALEAMPNVSVVKPLFSYAAESNDWVTNPNIGQALANYITCVASASRDAGGPGRVILITHSMGGLAAREAMSLSATAAADVGLLITIAAPNTGSWVDGVGRSAIVQWLLSETCGQVNLGCGQIEDEDSPAGQALVPGSHQLAVLPQPPTDLPIDAVAGDLKVTTQLFGATLTLVPSGSVGDVLVKPDSALLYGNRPGSQEFLYRCTLSITQIHGIWYGCMHAGLLYSAPVTSHVVQWMQCSAVAMMPAVNAYARAHGLADGAFQAAGVPTCRGAWASLPLEALDNGKTYGADRATLIATGKAVGDWSAIFVSEGYLCSDLPAAAVSALGPAADCIELPPFAAFAGTWYAHARGASINASGLGTYSLPDFIECPSCTTAGAPINTITFQLDSVSGSTATGSITASTDAAGYDQSDGQVIADAYTPGSLITLTITAAAPGQFLDLKTANGAGDQLCDMTADSAGECGA
jgi:pimeloyl-ACP methyl ester carboxylesterase